jgi:hypothetical protein
VLDRIAKGLLERETLDGDEVYNTIREMTGHEPTPPRPAPPGEGLVIGGHEVPEEVVTLGSGPVATGSDVETEVRDVEAEVAGAKRRAAQVPEPEKSA